MIIPYEQDEYPPIKNPVARVGRFFRIKMRNLGRTVVLVVQAFMFIPLCYKSRDEIARQLFLTGLRSIGVASIVAMFTGMIICLQSGLVMQDYGADEMVGALVTQTMCRGMGPIMAGLIIAACVGASMAAQLGTMAVSEEIAALEIMSINPIRFLVMPRLLAMLLMLPVITIYTTVIGVIGGGIVATTQLGSTWNIYYSSSLDFLKEKDIWVGVAMSVTFAFVIVAISCYKGMAATNGAVGVGSATRRAVVASFLAVLISGYIIIRIFY